MELPELPPYIYGRECGENERVWTERDMRAYAAAAVEAERERCARIVDEFANRAWSEARSEAWSDTFEVCAHRIRAKA